MFLSLSHTHTAILFVTLFCGVGQVRLPFQTETGKIEHRTDDGDVLQVMNTFAHHLAQTPGKSEEASKLLTKKNDDRNEKTTITGKSSCFRLLRICLFDFFLLDRKNI